MPFIGILSLAHVHARASHLLALKKRLFQSLKDVLVEAGYFVSVSRKEKEIDEP